MMRERKEKKLLILAGASVHCKLVEAAKALGVYTIVTDYLPNSPAKAIADEAWMLNITDVDAIVERCRAEHVDGVISGWIDPCQRPYYQICEKLNLPCYGTAEQFYKMTDKHAFKNMCMENGVDVIPEYTYEDVEAGRAEYPLFVKPVDSRGSRGQAVCYDAQAVAEAVQAAKRESSNGDIIIEKYMANAPEFQVTYFFRDGKPYLVRTVDSYTGTEQERLEKVVVCSVSPSRFTQQYLLSAHPKVIKMFENLGIQNGPVFMQGFVDNGVFRFFDPGLRFPGVDYEKIYQAVFDCDLMKLMVEFALTGSVSSQELPENGVFLNGSMGVVLFPTLSAGKIERIYGYEEIRGDSSVKSLLPRSMEGETIGWTYNVNQRLCEIDVLCRDKADLIDAIQNIQNTLSVISTEKTDMMYGQFDVARLEAY